MSVKILLKDGSSILSVSHREFKELMGVEYLPQLHFKHWHFQNAIEKRCRSAHAMGRFSKKQIWLGQYFSREMQQEKVPDVTIAWVDAAIGYGVWANDDIPPFTFVGEYTGSLRRPYLFKDLSNYYCFNYYITMSYWERNIRQPYLIDAQRSGNFTRYINHSYKPNLETASIYYQGMLHIVFYAKELIRKGAQLCYDYGPIYWEKRAAPLPLPNNIGLFF